MDGEGGSGQEAALEAIRSFQSDELKAFVHSELQLPSSMHTGFSKLRKMLASRSAQFLELKDLPAQMDYLLSAISEAACPRAWVAFSSSVSCLLSAVGSFPEDTASVFQTEAILGTMCALRCRYTIIALRDLWSLRSLKAARQHRSTYPFQLILCKQA